MPYACFALRISHSHCWLKQIYMLRLQAESKGFRLDDTGLFPATQGSGGKR
ncbi:DNA polymerase lambda-like, partial [Trifolium medium]|nr:DNA polymerase lambda-like [Trifolium medium]